uniref:Protein EXORDIUM-like 7 n=1 Tax=Ananas comosus var. bracteatus TaxID=296719 RepID=A0A6V7NKG7_ANACO|nr:unnamed protein product [Ananas comosus var. bracteatus]
MTNFHILLLLLLFSSLSTLSNLAMATTPPHQNPYNPFSLETPHSWWTWPTTWARSSRRLRPTSTSSGTAAGTPLPVRHPRLPPLALRRRRQEFVFSASHRRLPLGRRLVALHRLPLHRPDRRQRHLKLTENSDRCRYNMTAYAHREWCFKLILKLYNTGYPERLPLDPYNGLYLVLTSPDVRVEDFCREVCGFHYFTFSAIVGVTVPFAWVGHSGVQCPGMCAFPFALPEYIGGGERNGTAAGNNLRALGAPNGDVGVDGMISVIGHELAEMASNPLINAWYAGDDPAAPTEIADLCVGVYGTGGGGGYVGSVYKGEQGEGYNLNGVNGRRFLVQWLWNPVRKSCFGPNALN